mmetsp:Transcript_59998/g.95267  ORF Transcript_59998/g.95267 Transcript_59998/m.95267 type:complete len:227 (+) Transcript_59998:143-823(+)
MTLRLETGSYCLPPQCASCRNSRLVDQCCSRSPTWITVSGHMRAYWNLQLMRKHASCPDGCCDSWLQKRATSCEWRLRLCQRRHLSSYAHHRLHYSGFTIRERCSRAVFADSLHSRLATSSRSLTTTNSTAWKWLRSGQEMLSPSWIQMLRLSLRRRRMLSRRSLPLRRSFHQHSTARSAKIARLASHSSVAQAIVPMEKLFCLEATTSILMKSSRGKVRGGSRMA